ncbi:hypothetical protein [Laspinema palackyanum]|uniref:hypothetical protein n=1 Tax=Laspinema palackyanum TaxID=3231601 RepID=UPI00345D8DEA|nr:hypothetical protein [Laspinema sp. D2c]
MLLQKIIQELQNIPEEKLGEIYDLIHEKTATLTVNEAEPRTPGLLTGKLSDAFFEPLAAEELQRWE